VREWDAHPHLPLGAKSTAAERSTVVSKAASQAHVHEQMVLPHSLNQTTYQRGAVFCRQIVENTLHVTVSGIYYDVTPILHCLQGLQRDKGVQGRLHAMTLAAAR
jgi:hypothetical protein